MAAAAEISPFRIVHTVCSHDCPDSCGVLVTVDASGRAVKVQGDPKHPVTQGFLCGKVAKYLDRVYAPERILYPLKRKAGVAKGPLVRGREHEAFERVSWDEALDAIAARLQRISDEFGPESILPYSYAGTIGVLGFGSMDRRFFHRLGASQLDRTICSEAGGEAWKLVYGKKLGAPTEDFQLAKLVVAWGANIHGNNVHLWPFIEQARRNGGRLIVIDPYRTRTAALADWHIAIRPGTDGALALGMMQVILNEGLEDRAYIAEMTHGFEGLAERVKEYTPERVAAWTGMTAGEIEALAREYATTRPSAIRLNYGVQRTENGGTAVRAISMLPALTGAWKYRGGGGVLSTSGAFAWDKKALERPDLALASPLGRLARTVNMCELGKELSVVSCQLSEGQGTEKHEGSEGTAETPVKALFVYNSNPGAVAPDHNSVKRGMARTDLFTVVHELFFTDTTDYADYILPATTFLEHTDVQGAYGHYFVQLSQQAIEPPGEARPNVWLFGELAQRMGFEDACFRDTPETMVRQALAVGADGHSTLAGMEHVTVEGLKEQGHMAMGFHGTPEGFRPFTAGRVPTPSGKVEFYSETLAAQGRDGLPRFIPPTESRWGKGAERYPLEFLSRKADNYMNSTFAHLDGHRKMEARKSQRLEMHPKDAESRGIGEGDAVRIWNDRGALTLTAMLNASLPAGVVAGQLDWAKLSADGGNVNALTSERLTDIGAGATFYSTLVEVERREGSEEVN
jgi:molybdopterin guanine dinucleotide-containing S/N-oxide reductase-like protein